MAEEPCRTGKLIVVFLPIPFGFYKCTTHS